MRKLCGGTKQSGELWYHVKHMHNHYLQRREVKERKKYEYMRKSKEVKRKVYEAQRSANER